MIGTDSNALKNAIRAHVPELGDFVRHPVPPTPAILDLLEFVHDKIAEPMEKSQHAYFGEPHSHIERFDIAVAQERFRGEVNLLFSRNGLAYEMNDSGAVIRLGPSGLREQLARTVFDTGDRELDRILEDARRKFLDPDLRIRIDALEKLWDAWERVKTLEEPGNKRESIRRLLDAVASATPRFRAMLEKEAQALTDAGNSLMIRHSETNREPVNDSAEVDYLFHLTFAMIQLLLRKTCRLDASA